MIEILIVDDHPIFRAGLRTAIDSQPDLHVAGVAGTAEEALVWLTESPADVVLMDLAMPGIGGAAGTAAIKDHDNAPKVIVLTTFATDADIVAALDAGAVGYLLKDAEPTAVFDAIRQAALGGTILAPTVAARVIARTRPHRTSALSSRELDVLNLIAEGHPNRTIAQHLHISEATVKSHLVNLYAKLDVDNRTAAAAAARRLGLIRP